MLHKPTGMTYAEMETLAAEFSNMMQTAIGIRCFLTSRFGKSHKIARQMQSVIDKMQDPRCSLDSLACDIAMKEGDMSNDFMDLFYRGACELKGQGYVPTLGEEWFASLQNKASPVCTDEAN